MARRILWSTDPIISIAIACSGIAPVSEYISSSSSSINILRLRYVAWLTCSLSLQGQVKSILWQNLRLTAPPQYTTTCYSFIHYFISSVHSRQQKHTNKYEATRKPHKETNVNKKLTRRWDTRTWNQSILLPLLRLTPRRRGSVGTISVKFCKEVKGRLRYKIAKKYCRNFQPPDYGGRTLQTDRRQTDLR